MTVEQGSSAASVYGQTDSGLLPVDSIPALSVNTRTSPRRVGLIGALSLAVATCGIGSRGPAPTQADGGSRPESPGIRLAAGETPGTPESIGDRFDAFLAKYDKQVIDIDLAEAWMDFLGTPPEAVLDLINIDYGPFYIFEDYPEQTGLTNLKEYFEIQVIKQAFLLLLISGNLLLYIWLNLKIKKVHAQYIVQFLVFEEMLQFHKIQAKQNDICFYLPKV